MKKILNYNLFRNLFKTEQIEFLLFLQAAVSKFCQFNSELYTIHILSLSSFGALSLIPCLSRGTVMNIKNIKAGGLLRGVHVPENRMQQLLI